MGRVWKAHDKMLHRDVAIKEMVPQVGLTDEERQELRVRSLREARAIARLDHVNVVRIFDALLGDADDLWIVMEYVPSRSLHQSIVADGPLPPTRAAEIGLGVLDALRAAHRSGILHRDVKPANILLGLDGRVVLTDFGLATTVGDPQLTHSRTVLGSPAYVAPERAIAGTVGPEGDLWSLGAALFAAVEGQSPYARSDSMMSLSALVTEPPPAPQRAGPLTPVLEGLLRKDPGQRIDAETAERLLRQATHEHAPAADLSETGGKLTARVPLPSISAAVSPNDSLGDTPASNLGDGLAAVTPVRSAGVAPAATPAPRRARHGWVVAAGLAIGLAVGIPLATRRDGSSAGETALPQGDYATGATESAPPAPAPSPPASITWTTYQDERGFSLSAPNGWQTTRRGNAVEFREPGGDRAFTISQENSSKTAPLAQLKGREKARSKDLLYHRVTLAAVNYQQSAADWEYTYTTSAGTQTHVRERVFRTIRKKSYTMVWSVPESAWSANKIAFARLTDGFKAAPDPGIKQSTKPAVSPTGKATTGKPSPTTYRVNDTSLTYTGNWDYFPNRNLGDHGNDVTVSSAVDATAEYSFVGTGVAYLTEMNGDEGSVDVYLDGAFQRNIDLHATPPRRSQQVVFKKFNLNNSKHTIKIVIKGPRIGMIDALEITKG